MTISYEKLWKLLKENKMQKRDLASAAELSSYTMTKLNQNRPVSMEVVMRLKYVKNHARHILRPQ